MNDTPAPPDTDSSSTRHLVVVLFIDLSDSTRLSTTMEAETYATMLDEVRVAFSCAVKARGGTVNQFQGDGLQALFGHPLPGEHDGRRAAEAALEVHAAVRALRERYRDNGARGLSVHTGIHGGLTLARAGDNVAGLVELFGAAPGIAKHLSDIAEADEILASDETLGPVSHLFETASPRSVMLKGREAPLPVRRIVAPSARRTRFEAHSQRGLVACIGRTRELAALQSRLEQAAAGRSVFVLLRGPAGMGKTRLVEEFLARSVSAGIGALRGHCDGEVTAQPLQPLLQMLRGSLGISRDALPEAIQQAVDDALATVSGEAAAVRETLLHLLSVVQPPTKPLSAGHTLEAMRCVLASPTDRTPRLWFIDDWHWADDATRQLVHAISYDTPGLMVLAAVRSGDRDDLDQADADLIELAPLDAHDSLATVRELLPAANPFVAEGIVRQAGGNPLFIEELCHFATTADSDDLVQPVQGGPAWLQTLIAARVARLPPVRRQLLEMAAIIGATVPVTLLQRLTDCTGDHPDVRALAASDLLFPAEEPGFLRFKHGITRDVVYQGIGLQMRRDAHRRAAAALAPDADPAAQLLACEALAYHFSGSGEAERAAHYLAMAGDKAMAASSIDRAKAQYRSALAQLDRLPPSPERYLQWRSVMRRMGMASVFDPTCAELALFQRAIALAGEYGDAAGLAYAHYWLAYAHYALGGIPMALHHGKAALTGAEACADARLHLQVRMLLGQSFAAAGAAREAAAQLIEATSPLLRPGANGPGARPAPALAYALACCAGALADLGRDDEAEAQFRLALDSMPGPGHEVEASVLLMRSNARLGVQRWDEAAADAADAQRVAERVRSLYLLAMARALGAWADWGRSRDASALDMLARSTDWLLARDKRLFISLNHGRLAEAYGELGRQTEARREAAAALRRWRQQDPLGAAAALRALARLRPATAPRRLGWADRIASGCGCLREQRANAACRAALGLGG